MANAIKPLSFAPDAPVVTATVPLGGTDSEAERAGGVPAERSETVRPAQQPVLAEFRSGPLVQCGDAELAVRARGGDTAAYTELVGRYQVLVRNVARSMLQDYQDAEDIAQETFIKAYHSLGSLKEAEKFGPWLLTILRHTVLDFLRSNRSEASLEALLEDGFEPRARSGAESSTAALESHEEDLRTLEALNSLREDYREVIVLKHVDGLSYKEMAIRLNMSVSAVGEKLSRVRALLKRRIEKKSISKSIPGKQKASLEGSRDPA